MIFWDLLCYSWDIYETNSKRRGDPETLQRILVAIQRYMLHTSHHPWALPSTTQSKPVPTAFTNNETQDGIAHKSGRVRNLLTLQGGYETSTQFKGVTRQAPDSRGVQDKHLIQGGYKTCTQRGLQDKHPIQGGYKKST